MLVANVGKRMEHPEKQVGKWACPKKGKPIGKHGSPMHPIINHVPCRKHCFRTDRVGVKKNAQIHGYPTSRQREVWKKTQFLINHLQMDHFPQLCCFAATELDPAVPPRLGHHEKLPAPSVQARKVSFHRRDRGPFSRPGLWFCGRCILSYVWFPIDADFPAASD